MSDLRLSAPQNIYLNGLDTKFRAYVGGFGSGKTFVGCLDLLIFFSRHPGTRQGYFGPSYPSIRDIFYPTFEEAAEMMGFNVVIRESNKEIHVYRNGRYYGTVICRSMDNPASIVGFKISRALCDELDVLNADKAQQAWNKIIARMRLVIPGVQNSIGVTTTPEGFRFVYQQFKKEPSKSYSMVQASTYENEMYLPPDYISSLKETYDSSLIEAYLDGEFVNLTGGAVYRKFDRRLNHTDIREQYGDTLHIGMDFNVGKMSAVVHVERYGNPVAVNEFFGMLDTPDMIYHINEMYKGWNICVYPDSSGKNRKSNEASTTDISALEDAGFKLYFDSTNPRVRDRINAMNTMICNSNGDRRYKVNTNTCPRYTENLEQQIYNKQGEPDKSNDMDHMPDAGGYYIAYAFPIIKPITKVGYKWQR